AAMVADSGSEGPGGRPETEWVGPGGRPQAERVGPGGQRQAERVGPGGRPQAERKGATMGSEGLHEPEAKLRPDTIERHRANVSLKEELEAIDWYDQRADASDDDDLREVLRHNRDDEKEHAAMNLEWLRRHDPE